MRCFTQTLELAPGFFFLTFHLRDFAMKLVAQGSTSISHIRM
jgi:hypothetical protein